MMLMMLMMMLMMMMMLIMLRLIMIFQENLCKNLLCGVFDVLLSIIQSSIRRERHVVLFNRIIPPPPPAERGWIVYVFCNLYVLLYCLNLKGQTHCVIKCMKVFSNLTVFTFNQGFNTETKKHCLPPVRCMVYENSTSSECIQCLS